MRLVFSHVTVDQQQQDTSVEELSDEHSVRDGCQLLTVGLLADPLNTFDDDVLQNGVDDDNDHRDATSQDFGNQLVSDKMVTEWFLLALRVSIYSFLFVSF